MKRLVPRLDELLVGRVQLEAVAPVGEPADVLRDGPAVVVQDDDEPLRLDVDDVVERLVARARGQRAVADDRRRCTARPGRPGARRRSPSRRRGRSPRARRRACRGRSPIGSAKPERPPGVRIVAEPLPPPRDELVRVALVRRVPDEPVLRAVERAVERERQLDDAEVRGEMSARPRDRLDDELPAVRREPRERVVAQRPRRSCGPSMRLRRVIEGPPPKRDPRSYPAGPEAVGARPPQARSRSGRGHASARGSGRPPDGRPSRPAPSPRPSRASPRRGRREAP